MANKTIRENDTKNQVMDDKISKDIDKLTVHKDKLENMLQELNKRFKQIKLLSSIFAGKLPKHLAKDIERINFKLGATIAQLTYTIQQVEEYYKQKYSNPFFIKTE